MADTPTTPVQLEIRDRTTGDPIVGEVFRLQAKRVGEDGFVTLLEGVTGPDGTYQGVVPNVPYAAARGLLGADGAQQADIRLSGTQMPQIHTWLVEEPTGPRPQRSPDARVEPSTPPDQPSAEPKHPTILWLAAALVATVAGFLTYWAVVR